MKLLLQPWFPYAGSVVVHAIAWGACWIAAICWFALPELLVSHRQGDPLEVMVVMPSVAAQPETVEPAMELAVDTTPATTETEITPQELKPQRTQPDAPPPPELLAFAEEAPPPPSAAPPPPAARKSDQPKAAEPRISPPIARQTQPQPVAVSATVAVPYQPPRERGIVDALPQKLPASVEPRWPRAAWLAGAEGRVVLRVVVDAAGRAKIVEVEETSGRADFDDAALTAVRQWRFSPARRLGAPVEHAVLVPVRFSLRRG
jgi:protein TonB